MSGLVPAIPVFVPSEILDVVAGDGVDCRRRTEGRRQVEMSQRSAFCAALRLDMRRAPSQRADPPNSLDERRDVVFHPEQRLAEKLVADRRQHHGVPRGDGRVTPDTLQRARVGKTRRAVRK
jgi:hypothetical protein